MHAQTRQFHQIADHMAGVLIADPELSKTHASIFEAIDPDDCKHCANTINECSPTLCNMVAAVRDRLVR